MEFLKNLRALSLVGLMGIAIPFTATAQEQQVAPTAADVTSEEIEAFALAYQSVYAIEQQFAPVEIITIAQADPDLNDMILEKINQ